MNVATHADATAFRERAGPLLLADEARHNLHLGICSSLIERPDIYPEFHLWTVEAGGMTVLAALLTPPFNVLVSRPAAPGAVEALARALHEQGVALPGVVAAVPEVDAFVQAWTNLTDARADLHMAQRIYALTEVRPVAGVAGQMRAATEGDRDLLVAWVTAFTAEALGDDGRTEPDRFVDVRLSGQAEGRSGLFLWLDGVPAEPVSLVGYGGVTQSSGRIGPVYTPPPLRRRGYASALTAAVSAHLLARGRRFCFLYTDLSNPTSNKIYQDVGYRQVSDSRDYRFAPAIR
jgi:predicted GNAT family acetyltransferase